MKQLSPEEALNKLAAYCSTAERCVDDVRKKLIRWQIPEKNHPDIISRLQQEHFLDETRFCRAYVNDKLKFNKWGIGKIKFELLKKNIPAKMIDEIINEIDPEINRNILCQLLSKKKPAIRGENEYEIRQKLMRFALSRGFNPDEIISCIERLK